MYVTIPFAGSLYITRLDHRCASRPFFIERTDHGRGGREYLVAAGRWEVYLTSAAAIRAERGGQRLS